MRAGLYRTLSATVARRDMSLPLSLWLGLVFLLAACTSQQSALQRADVPPLSTTALDAARQAPEMRDVAELGNNVSNYKTVGELLRKAADAENPVALVQLGDRYRRGGNAGKQELATAANLYRRAAEQGYAAGEAALGKVYRLGEGVPLDKTEAAYWYRQAAQQRDADGMLLYGIALLGGEGVAPDKQQGLELITANDLPDKPKDTATAATGSPGGQMNILDLARQVERGTIKLRILAVVDTGKEFTPAEIDEIARDAAAS